MAELTREELIKKIQEKRRTFQNVDLSGLDLRGIDLQRLDFTGASFVGARLSGNRLSEGIFTRADFREADLSNCLLEETRLDHARMVKTLLVEANLEGARLGSASLRGADLSNARCARADFRGADLTRARLINTDLRQAQLEGANLTEAAMRGVLLREAELTAVAPESLAPPAVPEKPPQGSSELDWLLGQGTSAGAVAAPPVEAPERKIPLKVFTEVGWITGTLSLPVTADALAHLNRNDPTLLLRNARHPHLEAPFRTLTLRAAQIALVVPECEEGHLWLAPPPANARPRRVQVVLERRVLAGTLVCTDSGPGGELLSRGRWVVLREVTVAGSPGPAFPLVLVHTGAALALGEEG